MHLDTRQESCEICRTFPTDCLCAAYLPDVKAGNEARAVWERHIDFGLPYILMQTGANAKPTGGD